MQVQVDQSIARRLEQIGIVEPVAVARIEFDIGAEPLQRTGRLVIRDARVDRLRLHARNLLAAAIENLTVGAAADALVIAPIDLIVVAVGHRQLRTRQVLRQRLPAEPDFDSSEEHTSELQSLMRISYAVFCLTKQK